MRWRCGARHGLGWLLGKSLADWQNLSLNVTSRSRHPGGAKRGRGEEPLEAVLQAHVALLDVLAFPTVIDGRVAKGRAVLVWLLHEAQPHAGSFLADASNEVRSEVLYEAVTGPQRERSDELPEVEILSRA